MLGEGNTALLVRCGENCLLSTPKPPPRSTTGEGGQKRGHSPALHSSAGQANRQDIVYWGGSLGEGLED